MCLDVDVFVVGPEQLDIMTQEDCCIQEDWLITCNDSSVYSFHKSPSYVQSREPDEGLWYNFAIWNDWFKKSLKSLTPRAFSILVRYSYIFNLHKCSLYWDHQAPSLCLLNGQDLKLDMVTYKKSHTAYFEISPLNYLYQTYLHFWRRKLKLIIQIKITKSKS